MNWKPSFAVVLLGVTILTYAGARLLNGNKKRRLGLCIGLLALLPLVVFKYYNFINDSLWSAMELLGSRFSLPGLNWAIPIGISFFTFQAVGYLLDVFNGRIKAERNFIDYMLFICFFPQITSGPISKADELLPQIKAPHVFNYEQGRDGLKMLLWGMFLKLAIADRIGIYVNTVDSNYIYYSGAVCLFASVMYSIQIYCDFAGYSLMAIGIARTLGFNLVDNFRRPYFASSVTEFWRRWHISLTRWLTTHVYIALGGNRCSKMRQYLNIMITFLVSGIWHGANWTFVAWGALHGVYQVIEKAFIGERLKAELRGKPAPFKSLRIVVTFLLVTIAWILFRMPSIGEAWEYISQIFFDFGTFTMAPLDLFSATVLGLGMPIFIIKEVYDEYGKAQFNNAKVLKWTFWMIVAIEIITIGVLDCGQFIYVNF